MGGQNRWVRSQDLAVYIAVELSKLAFPSACGLLLSCVFFRLGLARNVGTASGQRGLFFFFLDFFLVFYMYFFVRDKYCATSLTFRLSCQYFRDEERPFFSFFRPVCCSSGDVSRNFRQHPPQLVPGFRNFSRPKSLQIGVQTLPIRSGWTPLRYRHPLASLLKGGRKFQSF